MEGGSVQELQGKKLEPSYSLFVNYEPSLKISGLSTLDQDVDLLLVKIKKKTVLDDLLLVN